MLPAWGLEEFTIHRGWAELANMLADAGYTCLRFNWPGSGDSLGNPEEITALDIWKQAATEGAAFLKQTSGVEKIIIMGHGVGALLAPHIAHELAAEGLVIMAPQSEGRMGMRELEAWSKMIASYLRMPLETSDNTVNVAGHQLSKSLAADLASLRTAEIQGQQPVPALAVVRAGSRSAEEWTKNLTTAGFIVTELNYTGYDGFVAHNRASVTPLEDFGHVRNWLLETFPSAANPVERISLSPARLEGDGFLETSMRFGLEEKLVGVLCRPLSGSARAVALLINSGDSYHIGWARMHVEFARTLAREGIASFRIDTRGIGDSGTVDGPPFFTEEQLQDVVAAVSVLAAEDLGPVFTYGLCSGGYASIQVAARDPRVKALVAVNPSRLVLAPDETFEQILNSGTSSIADYRRRAFSLKTLKGILSGRISLATLVSKGNRILKAVGEEIFQRVFGFSRLSLSVQRQAKQLQMRGVTSILVYAENDGGLDELARHFGRKAPEDYDHATMRIVRDAEHNMTARHARATILQALRDAAFATGPKQI
ncbi:alpha/beta hydrolase [Rhizobium oryzicola]|uniref:Alpha/beta fold hydrolase n=1 Tax=Rhizobium oryzicola TaxID=1232668 RepID=A0ABT8T564_9HYPH|nr:alpha/beta fold hydrolase [Rhizobium oryzicola]MDO1585248.1 alpha/beta fold hydrolase [Rhizobium oryzicola]